MDAPQDSIKVADLEARWEHHDTTRRVKDLRSGKLVPIEQGLHGEITWVEFAHMLGPGPTSGADAATRGFRVVVSYRAAPRASDQKVMWSIQGVQFPTKPKTLTIYQFEWLVQNFSGVVDQLYQCHEYCATLGCRQEPGSVAHEFYKSAYTTADADTVSVTEMDTPVLVSDDGTMVDYADHHAFDRKPLYRNYGIIKGPARRSFVDGTRAGDDTQIVVTIAQKLAPEAWFRKVSIGFREAGAFGKVFHFGIEAARWFQAVGQSILDQALDASLQLRVLGFAQKNRGSSWDDAVKLSQESADYS